MDLTAGTKATAASAAVVMAAGLAVILYDVLRNDLARSFGGACLAMTGLALIALVSVRKWVTDTSDERRILAAAQREAQAERSRYFAAQAALENEQGRLNRDMNAERHALAVRQKTEREALWDEFEERRATLIAETMEATVRMMISGEMAPEQAPTGNLIQFPHQQSQPERDRSREHGVVGP